MTEPPKFFSWTITKPKTGEKTIYNALHGRPVTSEHVKNSPAVRRWAGQDEIVISH